MSSEFITLFMFASMLILMATGQRVFGVIGASARRPHSGCGATALPKCRSTPPSRCSTGIR